MGSEEEGHARYASEYLVDFDAAAPGAYYAGLWASEHGHYKTFIQLAEQIQPAEDVTKRWDQMLEAEAKIVNERRARVQELAGVGR